MLVHSRPLRWLARPLLPKGWTAGSFLTADEVDIQRIMLETLGTRLAAVSIFSFLCKSLFSSVSYFAQNQLSRFEQSESIIFLVSVLLVQAVPSLATLLLLDRYHFSRSGEGGGTLLQSLLTNNGMVTGGVSDC